MPDRSERAERWVEAATRALARLEFDELVAGLSLPKIGAAAHLDTSHLNRVFLKPDLLREVLARASAAPTDVRTNEQVLRLLPHLAEGRASALAAVREAARANVAAFVPERHPAEGTPAELRRGQEVISWLAMIAADTTGDGGPVQAVARQYERLTDQYVGMYNGLLAALDRVPVAGVGTVERLAWVLTAVVDGLTMRAQAQPEVDPPAIFADVVVELFAGLTRRSADPEPDWAMQLAKSRATETRVLRDGRATRAALVAAIDAVDGAGDAPWLSMAGFPGELFGRAARASAPAIQVHDRVSSALVAGWNVRHLVAAHTDAQARHLRRGLAALADEMPDCGLQVRVAPRSTALAPVVVGEDFALLCLENRDRRGFVDALVLDGGSQTGYAKTAFARLWSAPETFELWSEDGPDRAAIDALSPTRSA